MAAPREDGGGETGPQWVPRGLFAFEGGGFESRAADGPVAITAVTFGVTRIPEPSANWLSELPDVSGRHRPQQAATRRPLARHQWDLGSADDLHSRVTTESQRTRREHYERVADGVKTARTVLRDNQVYIKYLILIACVAHMISFYGRYQYLLIGGRAAAKARDAWLLTAQCTEFDLSI